MAQLRRAVQHLQLPVPLAFLHIPVCVCGRVSVRTAAVGQGRGGGLWGRRDGVRLPFAQLPRLTG